MIARMWTARTTPSLLEAYLQHFSDNVQPGLRKIAGFHGATIFTRSLEGSIEIVVTTYWDSFEAVDGFAGPDRDSAVVADEAARLLSDFDRRVRHYEIAFADIPDALRGGAT